MCIVVRVWFGVWHAPSLPSTHSCTHPPVIAVVKHFVANNQETNRDDVDSQIDQRTLHEVYYPPYQVTTHRIFQQHISTVKCH